MTKLFIFNKKVTIAFPDKIHPKCKNSSNSRNKCTSPIMKAFDTPYNQFYTYISVHKH